MLIPLASSIGGMPTVIHSLGWNAMGMIRDACFFRRGEPATARSPLGRRCDPLHGVEQLPVADAAEGLPRRSPRFRAISTRGARQRGLWAGHQHHLMVMSARELEGREASPSAGVIDFQSVKTTESGGVCGYDAGKNVKGRKRHIMTDTLGLLLLRHPLGGHQEGTPCGAARSPPWSRHRPCRGSPR